MISSDELRCLPIGRDFMGKAYWFQMVKSAAIFIVNAILILYLLSLCVNLLSYWI